MISLAASAPNSPDDESAPVIDPAAFAVHPASAAEGKAKCERYGWGAPGPRGDLRRIPLVELRVDPRYQRALVGNSTLLNIAANFSWAAFGVLSVGERSDGSKWIIDGQQRTEALRRRGDEDRAPCQVFQSDGPAWEAAMFRLINTGRKPVSAIYKFSSAVIAGIEPYVACNKWLDDNDFILTPNAEKRGEFSFANHMIRTWRHGLDFAKIAMRVQYEIAGSDPLSCVVHQGIWYCEKRGVAVRPHLKKILSLGGVENILREARRVAMETQIHTGSDKTCGIAMLNVINHKNRRKIRFEDVSDEPDTDDGAAGVAAKAKK